MVTLPGKTQIHAVLTQCEHTVTQCEHTVTQLPEFTKEDSAKPTDPWIRGFFNRRLHGSTSLWFTNSWPKLWRIMTLWICGFSRVHLCEYQIENPRSNPRLNPGLKPWILQNPPLWIRAIGSLKHLWAEMWNCLYPLRAKRSYHYYTEQRPSSSE